MTPKKQPTKKHSRGLTVRESVMVESCYFQPRYAGAQSAKFWKEVNHPANDRALYDFACALQDLEARVLAVVNTGVRVRARKIVISRRKKEPR